MIWTVPVSSKGQITLPLQLRLYLGIYKPQAQVVVEKAEDGVRIQKLSPYKLADLYGIAKQRTAVKDTERLISEGINQMAEEVSREGVR